MNDELNADLRAALIEQKNNLKVPSNNVIGKIPAQKILNDITSESKLSDQKLAADNIALTVIAVFAQQGATAKNCDGNMTITIFDTIFHLSKMRSILAKNGYKNGLRKFAKTYANKILNIVSILELNGNLYNKICLNYQDRPFSKTEKASLSNFQVDNEAVPIELRNMIRESFKTKTFSL